MGDIRQVSDAEEAKYNLAFADLIWTYMTSHILVSVYYTAYRRRLC